jgi:ecdysteroid 25-hydroxylase CYP306A1
MFLEEKQKRVSENDPAVEFCTDIQLRHLLADIFGASLDTTLTTLRWILLLIGKYPDIQERVFQVC